MLGTHMSRVRAHVCACPCASQRVRSLHACHSQELGRRQWPPRASPSGGKAQCGCDLLCASVYPRPGLLGPPPRTPRRLLGPLGAHTRAHTETLTCTDMYTIHVHVCAYVYGCVCTETCTHAHPCAGTSPRAAWLQGAPGHQLSLCCCHLSSRCAEPCTLPPH